MVINLNHPWLCQRILSWFSVNIQIYRHNFIYRIFMKHVNKVRLTIYWNMSDSRCVLSWLHSERKKWLSLIHGISTYPFSVEEKCLDYNIYMQHSGWQKHQISTTKEGATKNKMKIHFSCTKLWAFLLLIIPILYWIPLLYSGIYCDRLMYTDILYSNSYVSFSLHLFGSEQLYMVMKCVTLQTSCSEREMCLHWMSGSGIWINVFRLDADWRRWFIVYNLRIYVFLVWQKMFEMAMDEFM